MKKMSVKTLWDNFLNELQGISSLENNGAYFVKVVSWIRKVTFSLGECEFESSWLPILIDLDSEKYVIQCPVIDLAKELQRLRLLSPGKMDTLVMIISNLLLDLVSINSGIDCPQCIDGELRYFVSKSVTMGRSIILACETCGWVQDQNGSEVKGFLQMLPASKDDLAF